MLQDETSPTPAENTPVETTSAESSVPVENTPAENTLPVDEVSGAEVAAPEGLDLDAIQADLEEIEQSMKQLRS